MFKFIKKLRLLNDLKKRKKRNITRKTKIKNKIYSKNIKIALF